MALDDLSELDRHHRRGYFPPVISDEDHTWGRMFFGPEDEVGPALVELLRTANDSLFLALREPGSAELRNMVAYKLRDESCYVNLTLGLSFDDVPSPGYYPRATVAIAGDLLAFEGAVIDSTDVVVGSLSRGGDLTVVRDPAWASYFIVRMTELHNDVLEQQKTEALSA